jgi:hypothetical protein
MGECFLEYFVDIDKIFEEYHLTHGTKYLVMWMDILPFVHG